MNHLRISWDVNQKQLIVKNKTSGVYSIVLFDNQDALIDIIREDSIFTKDQKWHTFNWFVQRDFGYHDKFLLTTFKLNMN